MARLPPTSKPKPHAASPAIARKSARLTANRTPRLPPPPTNAQRRRTPPETAPGRRAHRRRHSPTPQAFTATSQRPGTPKAASQQDGDSAAATSLPATATQPASMLPHRPRPAASATPGNAHQPTANHPTIRHSHGSACTRQRRANHRPTPLLHTANPTGVATPPQPATALPKRLLRRHAGRSGTPAG